MIFWREKLRLSILRTIGMFSFSMNLHSIVIAVAVKTSGSVRAFYHDLHFLLFRYRQMVQ